MPSRHGPRKPTGPTGSKGGVITYEVSLQQTGLIAQPFVDQLRAIGEAIQ